jgi:GntR family transcriptional regulator, transcriptional repressor for pyruvate dehydrogenase complex
VKTRNSKTPNTRSNPQADAAPVAQRAPQRARSAQNSTGARTSGTKAQALVQAIGQSIRSERIRAGDKLPAEAAIMQEHGVSRSVVREALSRLQASGMVETHHGIGTFVISPPDGVHFRVDPEQFSTNLDMLAVLELRISLETESAGLAAVRRSTAQLKGMRAALDAFESSVGEAGDTVSPDFQFHLLIAQATGNRYISDIMGHLGTTIIPRTRINAYKIVVEHLAQYLQRVNREHEEIYTAIERQDAEAARAAMRIHLGNSRERMRHAQEALASQNS